MFKGISGFNGVSGSAGLSGFSGRSGFHDGSPLGPELQPNFDMSQGLTGWVSFQSTLAAVMDMGFDAVSITADTGVSDFGALTTGALEVGKNYRVSIIARRGAQGTSQVIKNATWGGIPTTSIPSTSYQTFDFDVLASAVSGQTRIYAADSAGGVIGDIAFVRQISIKEIF